MIDKPYYVIDYSATNCFVDIRVNDVSVFCLNIEGQMASNIRINHAILQSGLQRVIYNVLPLAGEIELRDSVDFKSILRLYDASGDYIEILEDIDEYKIPDNTLPRLPAYKYEKPFFAEVPYNIVDKSWHYSNDLSKADGLRDLVDKTYKKMESIFLLGQYSQFIEMIAARETNFAVSMYLDEQKKEFRLKELLKVLQSSDYKVVPTSPFDIMMVHGDGKLVTLKKTDGCSAFLLANSAGEELFIDIKLHLPQGSNELKII